MRIFVTGAAGMLGRDMVAELGSRGHEVEAAGHRILDITELDAVRSAIDAFAPDVVVNCAAYTNVDRAESEPGAALKVNGLGPRNLALACQRDKRGPALLHISTDYIFDGEKAGPYGIWDTPNPINAYGASKLCGENYIRSLMNRYFIVRTSWLFGRWGRSFVSSMLELAGRRGPGPAEVPVPVRVVTDQRGCPTYTADLARTCADLVESGCFGIYHATNQGPTTWYEFAAEVFRCAGLSVDLQPATTAEFPRPARRPRNSVLDQFPLQETLGRGLPDWRGALAEVVRAFGF